MELDCRTPLTLAHTLAADGYELTYRVWRPERRAARGTVVLLNGIMSHSAWFFPLVDALVAGGLAVVGADRRGSGLNDVARGDAPTAKALIDDAMAVIDAQCPVGGGPLYLVGWCWGSVLGLNLVRALGERLTGLVMVAPGLFPSEAVQSASATHERAAAALDPAQDAPVIVTPIVDTMFTVGPYLEGFIRRDERRLLRTTPRFRQLMTKLSMGALTRLRRLSAPLLVLLAQDDEATDNDAVRRALAALPTAQLTVHMTVSGHAMQFDAPQFVTEEILAFVRAHPEPDTGRDGRPKA